MGRFDMSVPGAKDKEPPTDLAGVQLALDKARAEHPTAVIVLDLKGNYISRTTAGLVLPPNCCVLLEGTISADLGLPLDPPYVKKAPITQVITLPGTGYCSFSGGKVDAGRQVFHAFNATRGSMAVIDSVNITGSARDGIHTKTRKSNSCLFISGCHVYGNNGRGIWVHVASNVHSIGNTCTGNNMDGIDLDAGAQDSVALFNVCTGNKRHGVFVEEAVQKLIVFANHLSGNRGSGVHVWNQEVKGNVGPNAIVANWCSRNRKGTQAGGNGSSPETTAHGNLFFNNVCTYNAAFGLVAGNKNAHGNYISQAVSYGNTGENVTAYGIDDYFFFAAP